MPTSSPATHPSRSIHSATTDWNSPDESATESAQFSNGSRFQLHPLQVTWEMTQACDWKFASARARTRSPRVRDRFSTAEAFHLVEEVLPCTCRYWR